MQVRCAHLFLSDPKKKTPRPDNTEWIRRFPPKTSTVVTPTLHTPNFSSSITAEITIFASLNACFTARESRRYMCTMRPLH
jgi:hypothetical protein